MHDVHYENHKRNEDGIEIDNSFLQFGMDGNVEEEQVEVKSVDSGIESI